MLEQAVLDAFTTDKPCRRKSNRPPGAVIVDLEDYAQLARVAR